MKNNDITQKIVIGNSNGRYNYISSRSDNKPIIRTDDLLHEKEEYGKRMNDEFKTNRGTMKSSCDFEIKSSKRQKGGDT